jgi:MHS family proline/betaine transporter-like MFS transporter
MTAAVLQGGAPARRMTARQVVAATLGNALEWYDFAVYGLLAPIIGKVFFPAADATSSLLAAYGVLAVGYAARPLGSILFGHVGDRIGRKPALMLSVGTMCGATVGIALLPGYAAIGPGASALLVLLRGLQGLSVAGEYSSAAVLLVERSPPAHRGLAGSWAIASANLGFLIGAAAGAVVSSLLGDAAMAAWGWRIPFAFGAVVALYALLLRRGLEESPFARRAERAPLPAIEAVRDSWREILRLIGVVMPIPITYYVVFVYAASDLSARMHFTTAGALDISTLVLVIEVALAPATGWLADRVGRRPILLFVNGAGLLLTWPLWLALHQGSLGWILFAQVSLAVVNGIGWGVTVAVMVELMPARTRCSAAGIGYNICMALFAGTTPWVATWLVARTGDDFAPAWYIMVAALIGLVATRGLPEMRGRPLPA